jgi:hypothetical protein
MKRGNTQGQRGCGIVLTLLIGALALSGLLVGCRRTRKGAARESKEAARPKANLPKELTDIIAAEEIERITEAAKIAARAVHCDLEWKAYYKTFMQVERKKHWDEDQIALIGVLFGAHQWGTHKELSGRPCTEEERAQIKGVLDNKMAELRATKFSDAPTLRTDAFWYDLGKNTGYKGLIRYPVGMGHSILIIRFANGAVEEVEGLRAPSFMNDPVYAIDNKFSQEEWKKASPEKRLTMARDLIDSGLLDKKHKKQVIDLLGEPAGTYQREYGYKIISRQKVGKPVRYTTACLFPKRFFSQFPFVIELPVEPGPAFQHISVDSLAALVTLSRVMPNFSKQTLAGAEAPKDDMPMKMPLSPSHLLQPCSTPASMPTLALTFGGSTESL